MVDRRKNKIINNRSSASIKMLMPTKKKKREKTPGKEYEARTGEKSSGDNIQNNNNKIKLCGVKERVGK